MDDIIKEADGINKTLALIEVLKTCFTLTINDNPAKSSSTDMSGGCKKKDITEYPENISNEESNLLDRYSR